jgi:hypothetical protein
MIDSTIGQALPLLQYSTRALLASVRTSKFSVPAAQASGVYTMSHAWQGGGGPAGIRIVGQMDRNMGAPVALRACRVYRELKGL